jgi:thiol-disulfide isomerase/thioredoxin
MSRQILFSITAIAILAGFACIRIMAQKPDVEERWRQRTHNALITKIGDLITLPEKGSAALYTTLKIGDQLPKLECVDFDGKNVQIEKLFGSKATLVVFWATWCPGCTFDLPHERDIAEAYDGNALKVIGVNGDEDITRAKICIDVFHLRWPMIHAPWSIGSQTPDDGIIKKLGVRGWPTLLLFDSDRTLVAATSLLRTRYSLRDDLGNYYRVRGLDAALAKVLGPLHYSPYLSIVNE